VNSVNVLANVLTHQCFRIDLNFTNYGAATANNISIRLSFDGDLLTNNSASIINISQIISLETVEFSWNLTSKEETGSTNLTIEIHGLDFDAVVIYRQLKISSPTSNPGSNVDILSLSIFITIIALLFIMLIMLGIYWKRKKNRQQRGRKTNAKNVSP